ncbi:MAG: tetratricopeptide repeat protein [Deltaproteobacteria bacterium]|nr:tetratricopeptide repeat protein [Deltaproteobacteria bacterium]
MSKKDEIRELTKSDPFLEAMQKLGAWLKSHQTMVAASAGLVVLVGAGAAIATSRADKQSEAASKDLSDAQKTFDKQPLGATPAVETGPSGATGESYKTKDEWAKATEEKLNKVVSTHAGTGAARFAKLYLASLAMDKGEPAEAEKHYRAFIAETPKEDPIAATAHMGLAAALEDQKKLEDAIKEYEALVPATAPIAPKKDGEPEKEKKASAIAENALMNAARLYEELGNLEKARTAYERIERDYPSSYSRFKAQQRLSALPKKEG